MGIAINRTGRRRIVIVATALACLVTADGWVRWMKPALQAYNDDPFEWASSDLSSDDLSDIALMGSSRAVYALVPDQFMAVTGRSAHNWAIRGSVVREYLLQAKRLFARERPSLVVLGINAQELGDHLVPEREARYLPTFSDFVDYLQHDRPSAAVIGQFVRNMVSPGWALFDSRYELKLWGQERLARVSPDLAPQAFLQQRNGTARPSRADGFDHPWLYGRQLQTLEERLAVNRAGVRAQAPPVYSLETNSLAELQTLLDWFRENNIALLIVYLPNSPITEERWREVEPAAVEAIAQVCREHEVPFLLLGREQLPRTNADFIDERHVGLPLAHRISRRVAESLVVLGLLRSQEPQLAGTGNIDGEVP